MNELWARQYGEKQAKIMSVFQDMCISALDIKFSPLQQEVVDSEANPIMIVGGVRGGKSFISFIKAIPYLSVPDALIWIIGPDYFQTAEFDYLLGLCEQLGILDGEPSTPKEGSRRFKLNNGAVVQTKTGDDLKRIASFATDCVIVAEAGQQGESVLSKGLERNVEKGGLTVMSGTFEDALPWYAEIYEDWLQGKGGAKSFSLPTWSNTAVFPLGRDDPKFREMAEHLDDDEFDERLAAVPRAKTGLVHKDFSTQRHVAYLPISPDVPIEVAIDPGGRTYAVLVIQRFGESIHIVDEIYMHNVLTDDVIAALKRKHYYKRIAGGTIDIASKQMAAEGSTHEKWRRNCHFQLLTKYVFVNQGIQAITRFLRDSSEDDVPRLQISNHLSSRTKRGQPLGIRAEFVMRKWPADSKSKNEAKEPIKKFDHALNALGYYLFIHYGEEFKERDVKIKRRRNSMGMEMRV